MTAKYSVLRSDFQKSGSAKRRWKLSSPVNFAGSGEISRALVNASAKQRKTGTKKNRTRRTIAGEVKARPCQDFGLALLLGRSRGVVAAPGGE